MTLQIDGPRTSPRVPPHNIEAEESVLGAMLLEPDAAGLGLERLSMEDFYKPGHQAVFEAVKRVFDGNQPIDAITVADQLGRQEALDRVGGVAYLTELLASVPTTANVEYYIGIVEEAALRRKLQRAGAVVGEKASELATPIADVLDQAEQAVFAVADRRLGEGLAPISPLLMPALEKAEEMQARGSGITGLATGFRDLDRKLAGLQPANLVVIAARPSMGKSALALNIGERAAAAGNPVAVFTLEMSKEEVVQRMLCSHARVDSQRLRTGQLNPNQWSKLMSSADALYKMPVYVDDSASLTVTAIRAKARRLIRRGGLGLIIVDYLQLMHGTSAENRQQEIAEISRSLKTLARELHIPIIAVSQLNRSLESREDKRPRLGDLRESGAIEQDADVVMFIYRHEYYHPEAKEDAMGVAEVNIAKHRAGATGKVDMTFMPEFTLFGDQARDTPPLP
jgi:replicative DNA helicase